MHKQNLVLILFVFLGNSTIAQEPPRDSLDKGWSFSVSGYYYFVADDKNTITFIGTADRKRWHLEGRYNYEDRNTGSVFAGWRFEAGRKLQFEAIPMVGTVFGNTNGIAPGLELTLTYKKFDYYSETEYVVDFAGKENNFFYVWGELAISPIEPLRTGMVYQRTHLYQTELDIQKGIFGTYSFWKLTAGVYCFNPFSKDNSVVIAMLSIDF